MLKFFKPHRHALTSSVAALEGYGINPALRQALVAFFRDSESRELYRANPCRIAEKLHLTITETLRLLVIALKEGLVTLNWEVQCPVCRAIDSRPKRLRDLRTNHTCPVCHSVHETDADEQVRVTFTVDERLRRLNSQADDPDFRASINTRYGIICAHRLLTLQTFRDLFPRETIPPNESLLIRRVAILFTDLAGSTALYARRGDSQAYSLVRQHFKLLFQIVDEHNGVVIKTIGDAIMAAFTASSDALAAAIAMHRQINTLNQQLALAAEDRLILKIGIDAGPCISVTLNDRPDYFGTTVNTSARVQATSHGNDIAFTESVLSEPNAATLVENYSSLRNKLLLKGLDDPIVVHHLQMTKLAL